ncbi:hypothetical protein CPB85DRAFT_1562919 [Mucidula mucida]|nr:hypothetical protein CPB85DRAFT_1562919 [Mucidula mucida]
MAIDIGLKTEKPFQELIVTPGDLMLGSIAFGFFFGFAIRVTWSAVQETRRAGRFSGYIFMIWLEIAADCTIAVVAWSYLAKIIPPSATLFIGVVVLWVFQVQCLMLIIVNRLCILYTDDKQRRILRFITVGIVSAISISTACIWIPAQLQINHTYIWVTQPLVGSLREIGLSLADLTLNILFIRVVKRRLINYGLTKYDKVMNMDILLLGVTALHNGFVYCQFHPIVYIVKLHIEMTMSQLLIKVARSTGISVYTEDPERATAGTVSGNRTRPNSLQVHVDTQVLTTRHMDQIETTPKNKHLSTASADSTESSAGPSA